MELTSYLAIVGALTGVAGTVMGVITIQEMLRKNQVRLRIIPKLAWTNTNDVVILSAKHPATGTQIIDRRPPDRLAIEIINLSSFPVTISQVGLGNPERPGHSVFVVPETSPGYEWPAVVDPHRAVTVFQRIDAMNSSIKNISRKAYVTTECDITRFATSDALDWLADNYRFGKLLGHGMEEKPI